MTDKIFIVDLPADILVGIYAEEQNKRQKVIINVCMYTDITKCALTDDIQYTVDYAVVSSKLKEYLESSHHQTVESLIVALARIICMDFNVDKVKIRLDKIEAVQFVAKHPAIQITRTKQFFEKEEKKI
eukprot:TRINITY_DN750_c0_g1_i1.p1 TRINITY_DN750_c0_g1~~TRINITY_DN750_c0_g1_i1.p1  ORF type:complete len:129 (-),score=19.41 TRINITY_DN750_c0_g1_i1:45-431(-)